MSTTIHVFPTNRVMLLVEQTRARTQELFQQLLDRHGIESVIEVKVFFPSRPAEPVRYVAGDVRWQIRLMVGFKYLLNGEWDSSSWPLCSGHDPDDVIREEDLRTDDDPDGAAPEFLGEWWIADELADTVPPATLTAILRSDHYWVDFRNMGGPAVSSTGYGLVAAALAEATRGVIASFDFAFADTRNGQTAKQFLSWWGDQQIAFYGTQRFRESRSPRDPS